MNKLALDPKTGYLEADNPGCNSFTIERKLKILELAQQYAKQRQFPDITSLCDAVGISYPTFTAHLRADDKFAHEWNQIRARVFHGLTNELSIKACSKNGIVANIAMLRYLESGTFNPESRIIHSSDTNLAKAAFDRISSYKDAEIVENDQITGSQGDMVDKSA